LDLEAADPTTLSPEEKEIAMDMQEWFKEFERELKAKGVEESEQRILEKGRMEGLEPLVHQFERRLARPLTASERATLVERLREQGAKRVGDVVLDLSPEDLATWLAETKGH
jgi:flagellar biosynthesis/type III secretory pathway protein FliH